MSADFPEQPPADRFLIRPRRLRLVARWSRRSSPRCSASRCGLDRPALHAGRHRGRRRTRTRRLLALGARSDIALNLGCTRAVLDRSRFTPIGLAVTTTPTPVGGKPAVPSCASARFRPRHPGKLTYPRGTLGQHIAARDRAHRRRDTHALPPRVAQGAYQACSQVRVDLCFESRRPLVPGRSARQGHRRVRAARQAGIRAFRPSLRRACPIRDGKLVRLFAPAKTPQPIVVGGCAPLIRQGCRCRRWRSDSKKRRPMFRLQPLNGGLVSRASEWTRLWRDAGSGGMT